MKMKEYTRKPAKVEAIQWTGSNADEVGEFTRKCFEDYLLRQVDYQSSEWGEPLKLTLTLARCTIDVCIGDYIIRNKLSVYVINEAEFKAEYEEVEKKNKRSLLINKTV
jgi:hypothetical protein